LETVDKVSKEKIRKLEERISELEDKLR